MGIQLRLVGETSWQGEPVRGERLHRLLSLLAEAGDAGLSREEIVEGIWGEDLPAHPSKALHVLVSRLRAATATEVVQTTARGYRLGLAAEEVDLLARREALARARAALAAGAFTDAREHAAAAAAIRTDSDTHRILALADSHLGRHEQALELLERLVREDVTDDDATVALLQSLAAVRGPAAALQRFEQIRRALIAQFGMSPGPQLQSLHQELLAADEPVRSGIRTPVTSLIGRSGDLERIEALLGRSRLVSIVGTGGLGKTRLAQTVAHRSPRPVVHVVELAGVRENPGVTRAIADAVNLRDSVAGREHPNMSLTARLAEHLRGVPTLLVLDNCEQVVSAVADTVAFLLAQVEGLSVLTTSRTPLHLTGEHLHQPAPLESGDAVALFGERARAARPGVVLEQGEINELVAALDGIPLAIELAAAQVRSMSVPEILKILPRRFDLLRSRDRSSPARHRTLRHVIDWSWQLLSEDERRVLLSTALAPDGLTNPCARRLFGDDAPALLASLADHSLLERVERSGRVRYRMLQTVRQYAMEHLDFDGTLDRSETALLWRVIPWCLLVPGRIFTSSQLDVVAEVHEESINLRAALDRAVARGDVDATVALLGALAPYWLISGEDFHIFDQINRLEALLEGWEPPLRMADAAAGGLAIAGLMWAMMPLQAPPVEIARVLRRVEPAVKDPYLRAFTIVARSFLSLSGSGEDPDALLSRMTTLGSDPDRHVAMCAAPFLAGAQENAGAPGAAIETLTAALARTQTSDAPWIPSVLRMMLASMHGQMGDLALAADHAAQALPFLDRIRADSDALQCRTMIALADLNSGDLLGASAAFEEIDLSHRSGRAHGPLLALLFGKAELAFRQGDLSRGLGILDEAYKRMREQPTPFGAHSQALNPWSLITHGTALGLRAWYDPSDDPHLWVEHLHLLRAAVDPDRQRVDFPVLGTLLFGVGIWGLRKGRLPAQGAADLLAAAEAMKYNRSLPALSWARARQELQRRDPAVLDRGRHQFAGLRGRELLRAASARVELIVRADTT